MNKEILNKIQCKDDFPVRITFDVICNSHTSMGEGDTLKERIQSYIDECTDAMDDSMRHWGDHTHVIDPIKAEIYDEDENSIDVTDGVLGEERDFTVDELHNELNELLDKVEKYSIKLVNIKQSSLMNKPDDLNWRVKISLGKYLHTEEPRYSDPTYWIYPEGIEEKIKDDKLYKVWYSYKDAADPADSTTWNYVKYIENIIPEKIKIYNRLLNILDIFRNYENIIGKYNKC